MYKSKIISIFCMAALLLFFASCSSGSGSDGDNDDESSSEVSGTDTGSSDSGDGAGGTETGSTGGGSGTDSSIAVSGVSLNITSLALYKGETETLIAALTPADASDTSISWTSGDESVATVGSDGAVSAIGGGTTDITVTTNDGSFTSVCTVEVFTAQATLSGDVYTYTLPEGTVFDATLTPDIDLSASPTFPTETDDSGTAEIPDQFIAAQTEVTYQLWKEVYDWAVNNGYTFTSAGCEGDDGTTGADPTDAQSEPVTSINWLDSMVWCNALTEYFNAHNGDASDYECVYTYSSEIIRDSSNSTACGSAVQNTGADGFRLLTSTEWQYAARYLGTTAPATGDLASEVCTTTVGSETYYWTPGNYASGATTYVSNTNDSDGNSILDGKEANDAVAVYGKYINNGLPLYITTGVTSTSKVGQKNANALGLYDMSGNVSEWCFDWLSSTSYRIILGGSFAHDAGWLRIGFVTTQSPLLTYEGYGFRIARSL